MNKELAKRKVCMSGVSILLILLMACNDADKAYYLKPVDLAYLETVYRNDFDTVNYVRFFENEEGIHKLSGVIRFTEDFLSLQSVSSRRLIAKDSLSSTIDLHLNNGYRKEFDNEEKVMFIQLQISTNSLESAYEFREQIGERLVGFIEYQNLGSWMAEDFGAGGLNCLFVVNDWDKAQRDIIRFLNGEKLLDKVLIAKRLYVSDENWQYEVVYPANFSGAFNSM
ncbi:hypothetical protein [Aureibacter tunicatorum]|uniref:Uncharacterized protein n=1 Tax=Aureibacter tunicatorum TaxID=866807 RepID=A0AAE3XP59_9BACT|nr:hypothetical protein [Aureibacter tunicatorum]MDR6240080.1 hypothetical protein [Aureibacter tunicatorum]